MKKIIAVLFFAACSAGTLQAQFLKKLKDKVNRAVDNSIDRTTDKAVDKTVSKPINNTADKVLNPTTNQQSTQKIASQTSRNAATDNSRPMENTASFPPEAHVVDRPYYMAIDSKDNLYVTDKSGITKITPDGTVQRISSTAGGVISIGENDQMYVTIGSTINRINVDDKGNCKITYYAGDKNYEGTGDGSLETAKFNKIGNMFVAQNGDLYIADVATKLIKDMGGIKSDKLALEPDVPARLKTETSWDWWAIIRKISNGKVTTLKNSNGQYILLCNLTGMTVDSEDNIIYSGGGFSRAVRKLDTKTMQVSTLAGKPFKREWCPVYTTGDTSKAELFDPGFLLSDKEGNIVYSDNRNHRITKIANGKVSTVAGNNIIDPCSANIGGRAQEGHQDGKAATALFNFPKSMVYDSAGNLFIVDSHNYVIRKVSTDGIVSSFTPFDRSKADINR